MFIFFEVSSWYTELLFRRSEEEKINVEYGDASAAANRQTVLSVIEKRALAAEPSLQGCATARCGP